MLSLLWEFCDVDQSGMLDKTGLCVALRCVFLLRQNQNDVSVLTRRSVRSPNLDWPSLFTLDGVPRESTTYAHDWPLVRRYFNAYRDCEAGVSGSRTAIVLRKSQLSEAELARIWQLADRDHDRALCFEEFALAIWLVGERLANPFADLPQYLSDKFYLQTLNVPDDDVSHSAATAATTAQQSANSNARYAWLGPVPASSAPPKQPLVFDAEKPLTATTTPTATTATTTAGASYAVSSGDSAAETGSDVTAATAAAVEAKVKRRTRRKSHQPTSSSSSNVDALLESLDDAPISVASSSASSSRASSQTAAATAHTSAATSVSTTSAQTAPSTAVTALTTGTSAQHARAAELFKLIDGLPSELVGSQYWLAHEGKLGKLNPNNVWQSRHFFLFDHALVWCTARLIGKRLDYRGHLQVRGATVSSIDDVQFSVQGGGGVIASHGKASKNYTFRAASTIEKHSWLDAIAPLTKHAHHPHATMSTSGGASSSSSLAHVANADIDVDDDDDSASATPRTASTSCKLKCIL